MRLRQVGWLLFLTCALVLLAYGWTRRLASVLAHPQLRSVTQLYGKKPPRLENHGWNYDKADLPSARIDHPVLEEKPWWERPREEWRAVYDSWPEEKRSGIPDGAAGMGRELARLRSEAEGRVAPVMALSEGEMLRYVPPQSPIGGRRNYCPACRKGKLVWVGPAGWNQVRCPSCGLVFPNDRYPADRTHNIRTPGGKEVEFHYHRDERGFNHFFEALTYAPKRHVALTYANMFARAHQVTGRPEYARRAALLLERFAEVFPDWCMTNSEHPLVYVETNGLHSGGAATNFDSGRWGSKVGYECAASYEYAYDLVYESEELDRLSEERGRDVREHIERYLFYENIAVYYSGGWEVGVWGDKDHISQAGIARKARVLNSADIMHRCRNWAEKLLYGRYHYDGMFAGTVSHHARAAEDAAEVAAEIQGWTDPPGFKHYLGFPRMEDFDRDRDFPLLSALRGARQAISYPDGRDCPSVKSPRTWFEGLGRAGCRILPGWGHAVLGAGSGERAVQAHLHFSGDYGRSHRDNLSVMLFAFGREMLSDIGYYESDLLSRWTINALSHNTVVIDRRSQSGSTRSWDYLYGTMQDRYLTDGDLEMYVARMPGMAAVAASGERAYPGDRYGRLGVDTFRRMQILVTVDPERPYVVDVFGVKGGSMHDYVLHGSCDHPMAATASVELESAPLALLDGRTWPEGARPREWPASWVESYGLFRNVRRAATGGDWTATFTYRDRPGTGVRIHMVSGEETELFLAESPSVRRMLAHPGERVQTDFLRPSLIARRRGEEGLESLYVAVIEPFRGGAEPARVERLDVEPVPAERSAGGGRPLALRVSFPEREDTILISWGGPGRVRTTDGAELDGIIGLVSEIGGVPAAAYLVGGTRFEKGDVRLSLEAGLYEGVITGSLRVPDGDVANALVTTAELPEGEELRGSCMILNMGRAPEVAVNTIKKPFKVGHLVGRVERNGDRTRIHTLLGDHGLRVADGGTTEVYCPQRDFTDNPTFVIHRSAWEFVPAPAVMAHDLRSGPAPTVRAHDLRSGPAPAAQPAGGHVIFPVEVTIRCKDERAEVHYTLDGSEPTLDSRVYTGPFTLEGPARVRARAFREGWGSAVSGAEFTGALEPGRKDAAGLVKGLDYEYWEVIGGPLAEPWDDPPMDRGRVDSFDLTPVRRETDFALRYTGYLRATADGVYEVSLTSEGPSRFVIGLTTVARRDVGSRKPLKATGRVALKKGVHPVTVTYIRGGEASHDIEARGLSVECSGPGVQSGPGGAGRKRPGEVEFFCEGRFAEAEPRGALSPGIAAPGAVGTTTLSARPGAPEFVPGVIYRYYEDRWRDWPVFELYTPAKSGVAEAIRLHESRAGPFALVIEGYVDLPAGGEYTFYLSSRDQCIAYVDDAPLVMSRGWNGQMGSAGLGKGRHALRVEYVKFDEEVARGILSFEIEGPGVERHALGPADLLRPPLKVEIEPAAGPITGPVVVKLAPEREGLRGMDLRYTLDGSEPTRRSRKYDDPFTVAGDVTVKARAFLPVLQSGAGGAWRKLPGLEDGPVAEAVYTAVPPKPDVYVSDLTPTTSMVTFGRALMDKNARGKPIVLAGKTYRKGLGAHAYSELTYELRPEYERFVAVVGVDDMLIEKRNASVEFVVYVDGSAVARTPVLRPGRVWHVNAALPEGGRELKLVLDGGPEGRNVWSLVDWKNLNVWDYGDWAEAGFVVGKPE